MKIGSIIVSGLLLVALAGCQGAGYSGPPVTVQVNVDSMARSPDAPFRYYGSGTVVSPSSYAGIKPGIFLVSFNQDPTNLKTLSVVLTRADAELYLRGRSEAWTGSLSGPRLYLEIDGGKVVPLNSNAYAAVSVNVRARVRSYTPQTDPNQVYVINGTRYAGDLAECEVLSPEKFAGTILHVLVFGDSVAHPETILPWRQIGQIVEFDTVAETLMGEPWGITPVSKLWNLEFIETQ